jgi:group I intron endonuclease
MDKVSGIYQIVSPSGRSYIGGTTNLRDRKNSHFRDCRKGRHGNINIQQDWNKYGSMIFKILFICSPIDLLFYEQRSIDILKPEYNICLIADSSLGVKRRPETREKLRISHLGTKDAPETVEKKSAASRLGWSDPIIRERREVGLARARAEGRILGKGSQHTEASKAKMSASQFRRYQGMSEADRARLANHARGNQNRLGAVIPQEMRDRISAKLKGRPRDPEAIAKQRATWAAKRFDSEVVE